MKRKSAALTVMFVFLSLLCAQAEQGKPVISLKAAMELDKNGKHSDAVEAIKRIIERGPAASNMQAYLSLGLVYFRDGDYENALANFSRSIEIQKNNPMSYYFMGMIYEKKALGTPKFDVAKEMKTNALHSWQSYLSFVDRKKVMPDAHRNVGFSIKEGIRRAQKHIEILQEGLAQ